MNVKWHVHHRDRYTAVTRKKSTGNPKWDIARVYTQEHAALIVKAVNCHDDLLEALKDANS